MASPLSAIDHVKELSDLTYAAKKKLTQRDHFLAEIDSVPLRGKLYKTVEPFYPKGRRAWSPPTGLASMLSIYVAPKANLIA